MKGVDATHTELDRNGAVVGISSSEAMLRDPDSEAAASAMFTVPCWWSWKTAMLARANGDAAALRLGLIISGYATKGGAL